LDITRTLPSFTLGIFGAKMLPIQIQIRNKSTAITVILTSHLLPEPEYLRSGGTGIVSGNSNAFFLEAIFHIPSLFL
jgi:hypothetical protein